MSKLDLDSLRQKYQEITSKGSGGNEDFLKKFINIPTPGETVVRILPTLDPELPFYKEYSSIHWEGKNYSCLKDLGQKCPITEVYFALWKTGIEENIALARKIRARKKFWMNVVERDTGEVKILSCGIKLFEKILSTILDEDFGDITDLNEGWDFKVKKVKQGDWPDYSHSAPKPKQIPAGTDQEIDRWMNSLHDIHGIIKYPEYEVAEKIAAEILSHASGAASLNNPSPQSGGGKPEDLLNLLG
tara:strand:- start:1393 stop:2127 length:735 start_codon:yes stop_codon:yes gene_type:complete